MARSHGRYARLYVSVSSSGSAAPLVHVSQSDLNLNTDKVDVTAFSDTTKTYVAGLPDGQLSFSGFASDTASTALVEAALDGVARKFYFYPFSSDVIYFYGTGFFDWQTAAGVSAAVTMSGTMAPATAMGRIGF